MAPRTWLTVFGLTIAFAASAGAQERRERARENPSPGQERAAGQAQSRERAVPRAAGQRREDPPARAATESRRNDPPARSESYSPHDGRRDPRRDDDRRDDEWRGNGRRDYGWRGPAPRYGYAVPRRYPTHVVRPTIVRVIPYRPYVYRPSYSIGVYYGSGGYYPYGYTPRGYFEPIPGRLYGGVRITGAPRDARVFADGYYVGLVNDFDGIFQHMNLEAGPHHIEIDLGYDAIAFDVYVRPGETTTFRADRY